MGALTAVRDRSARVRGRIASSKLVPAVPLIVLGLLIFAAVAAPWLTEYDPVRNDLTKSLLPPAWRPGGTADHLLGTDRLGRDVFTRLLYGARVSLLVVLFSMIIAVTIGTVLGITAGYVGGRVDSVIMRAVDVMLALPALLVALVVSVSLGPSFRNLVLILGLLIWPNIARLVRGEAMALRTHDFVLYSRAIGVSRRTVLRRHIFPNILPTLLVATTLEVANVILTEASLSFLGAGLPPPTASWGVMVDDGRALIHSGWWISMFSGLLIVVSVLTFNALGDWMRDRYDPETRELA